MIKNSKNHLTNARENYLQHMRAALKISFQLLSASIKAFIHSIIPAFFTKSASTKIKELNIFIEERKKNSS
jgi:hypothetical protein